jgi:two-component system, NarL family, nitrate/nitrite response regulator NarL
VRLAFALVIDVLLADGQPLFRDAVARVIRQDPELRLVAEVKDGRTALVEIGRRAPTVAVVARELSDLDGDRVLAAVTRDGLATRVLLLDATPGPHAVILIGDGAAGVISRRITPDALRAAVHRAASGRTVLCEETQEVVADEIRARHVSVRPLLSPRELEVLRLEAEGSMAPEIARRLQIATSTVRTHHKHLLEKLQARDRAQLVSHAMRLGLLE